MASTQAVFNPLMPEFHSNPYPFYRALREEDPVHQSPLGIWVCTRYDDAVMVLRDPRFGREGMAKLMEARLGLTQDMSRARDMLFQDPPDHTRLRALVSRAFTPRVVEVMRPHVQEIVDGLLDRVEGARGMDVIEDLAYPLPVTVICEMLGVPASDQDVFKKWSADIARSLDAASCPPTRRSSRAAGRPAHALADYFRSLIATRRKDPKPDLLSALIAAEEQGDKLSEGELVSTCVLLLIAGHETTVNLIGNGLLALLQHPDQLRALRDDPALIQTGVEELLRYDGPVQRTARMTHGGRGDRGQDDPQGLRGGVRHRRRQPRSGAVRRSGSPRRLAEGQPPHRLRLRHPLLSRGAPRPPGRADRPRHAAAPHAQARPRLETFRSGASPRRSAGSSRFPSHSEHRRTHGHGRSAPLSLTRRDLLKLGGVAVAAGAAGSGLPLVFPGEAEAQTPKRGGTFRIRFHLAPVHFDPQQTVAFTTMVPLSFTHSRLVKVKAGSAVKPGTQPIEPDLAESWTQPNDTTYIFKLRQGVRWHNKPPVNGRELTAEDVNYTYERFLHQGQPQQRHPRAGGQDRGARQVHREVHAAEPFAWFLDALASTSTWIIAKEAVDQYGDLKKPESCIGTGPCMLERYEPNLRLTFVRNPNYFVPGLPYVDGVDMSDRHRSRLAPSPPGCPASTTSAPSTAWCVRRSDLDIAPSRASRASRLRTTSWSSAATPR